LARVQFYYAAAGESNDLSRVAQNQVQNALAKSTRGGLDQIPGAGSSDRWAKSQGTWSGKTKKKSAQANEKCRRSRSWS